jgi:N-acyl-phosphatidylethanolamine-hydrolysing phospholipase D
MISLDAVEGTRVVEVINPDTVIPIHHSTFSFYVEPITEFASRISTSSYPGNLVILREGDSWTDD